MNYDIITIGGAVEDITFYTDDGIVIDNKQDVLRQRLLAFEYGAKIRVREAHTTFGGGAANVAVSASRLGLKTACVCAVGDDARGKSIIANLAAHHVNTQFVQTVKGEMSGFSFLLVGPGNEHVIFSHRAANTKLSIPAQLFKNNQTIWVYITSLSGNWQKALKAVFSRNQNFKIAWNPGGIQLRDGQREIRQYLKYTEVIIMNEDEATELVAADRKVMAGYKESARFLGEIKNLLSVIKSYGPEIVMITRGKKGADAYDGRKFYHLGIKHESKRVDTTGVGDAFGSSFVCGLKLYNGDIAKAMELGMRNAASVIAKQGAQNGLLSGSAVK